MRPPMAHYMLLFAGWRTARGPPARRPTLTSVIHSFREYLGKPCQKWCRASVVAGGRDFAPTGTPEADPPSGPPGVPYEIGRVGLRRIH